MTIFFIQQGEAELHPFSDITNRNQPAQRTAMNNYRVLEPLCHNSQYFIIIFQTFIVDTVCFLMFLCIIYYT